MLLSVKTLGLVPSSAKQKQKSVTSMPTPPWSPGLLFCFFIDFHDPHYYLATIYTLHTATHTHTSALYVLVEWSTWKNPVGQALRRVVFIFSWDMNPGPCACKAIALPRNHALSLVFIKVEDTCPVAMETVWQLLKRLNSCQGSPVHPGGPRTQAGLGSLRCECDPTHPTMALTGNSPSVHHCERKQNVFVYTVGPHWAPRRSKEVL